MPEAWFAIPFEEREPLRPGHRAWISRLARDRSLLEAHNVSVSVTELPDHQGLVFMRAPSRVLGTVSRGALSLSEAEARQRWQPCWWSAGHLLHARPLTEMVAHVRARHESREQQQLMARWTALGFGQGWRLPRAYAWRQAQRGHDPASWRGRLACLWADARGTITTSVLDNFNRANGALGANWGGPIWSGDGTWTISGNQISGAAAFNEGYWAASSFNANSEAFVTLVTIGTGTGSTNAVAVYTRITGEGTATPTFYNTAYILNDTTVRLVRCLAGTEVFLVTTGQSLSAGHKLGIAMIGSTFEGYADLGAGWVQINTTSDSNITAGGRIGCSGSLVTTTWVLDDFGGGNATVATWTQLHYRWRRDDGSETGATWARAEDTPL